MIYLDGPQNMLNPDSFYARAFFVNQLTKGCQGNSICVYSYGAMSENPIYLNETAKNFKVRVWRPVETWEQYAGWQAILQRIPSNPRFYVVSPCFANAKVWKTSYNGEPTIFVYPEKVDVGDNASNYCYADTNLVNQYVATWAISDTLTVLTTIIGFGGAEGAMELVSEVVNTADPVTVTQSVIEGAISWPSWPFKPLTWETIAANGGKIGIKQITIGNGTVIK